MLQLERKKIFFKSLLLALFIIVSLYLVIPTKDSPIFIQYNSEVGRIEQFAGKSVLPHSEVFMRHVRNKYLMPPSTKPYNISTTLTDTSMGQAAVVFEILNQKKNGFFVECGALDGETRSNTYWLERQHGWSGVLIEPNPENFQLLLTKHRKAYAVPACLSSHVHSVSFYPNFNLGKIVNEKKTGSITVQCFTLWTVMLALNQTRTIDYLSLDVEGHELEVLRAIPFELLNIRTMSVEWKHGKNKIDLRKYVESNGYEMTAQVRARNDLANDFIFVKKKKN